MQDYIDPVYMFSAHYFNLSRWFGISTQSSLPWTIPPALCPWQMRGSSFSWLHPNCWEKHGMDRAWGLRVGPWGASSQVHLTLFCTEKAKCGPPLTTLNSLNPSWLFLSLVFQDKAVTLFILCRLRGTVTFPWRNLWGLFGWTIFFV